MSQAAAVSFAVLPSFEHLVLSDEQDIKDAVAEVLAARNKSDPDGTIVTQIIQHIRGRTVGDLRRFTDHDWRALNIPALAIVYLKCVVRQSARPRTSAAAAFDASAPPDPIAAPDPFIHQFQLNYGRPFDMKQYRASLDMLASMGFNEHEALEALCTTRNQGVEAALEVLVETVPAVRKERRSETARQLGKMATGYTPGIELHQPPASAATARGPQASCMQSSQPAEDPRLRSLSQQLQATTRQQLEQEQRIAHQAQVQTAYKEYVRGMTADESMSRLQFECLQAYRRELSISEEVHTLVLHELGLTVERFEEMKEFTLNREQECVVCLATKKNHLLIPCMHLCLCGDCGRNFQQQRTQLCPMCSKPVEQIVRIYA